MARLEPTTDPYRILGLLRGASATQVKAAYRRLAKRYHPDGEHGDETAFLAVQAAYQLLADPIRRGDWDRAHAPGPVRTANVQRRSTAAASAGGWALPSVSPDHACATRTRHGRCPQHDLVSAARALVGGLQPRHQATRAGGCDGTGEP